MNISFEEWIKDDSMEERDNTTGIMVLVLGKEVYLEILGRGYIGL